MKSDREMPHDSFLLLLSFLIASLLIICSKFPSFPPPRKSPLNNNILAAVEDSPFFIIVVICLIWRNGEGERDVFFVTNDAQCITGVVKNIKSQGAFIVVRKSNISQELLFRLFHW